MVCPFFWLTIVPKSPRPKGQRNCVTHCTALSGWESVSFIGGYCPHLHEHQNASGTEVKIAAIIPAHSQISVYQKPTYGDVGMQSSHQYFFTDVFRIKTMHMIMTMTIRRAPTAAKVYVNISYVLAVSGWSISSCFKSENTKTKILKQVWNKNTTDIR